MRSSRIVLLVSLLGLTGCNQYWERKDTVLLTSGDSVAANALMQTPDPWPARSRDINLPVDGDRIDVAIQRYKAGPSSPNGGAAPSK